MDKTRTSLLLGIMVFALFLTGLTISAAQATTDDPIQPQLQIPSFELSYKIAPLKVELLAPFEYQIVVYNSGTLTATGLTISDPMPWNTVYISDSLDCTGGSCGYDAVNNQVVWVGDVAPDQQISLTFHASATSLGWIWNTAIMTESSLAQPIELSAPTWVVPEIYYAWDFEQGPADFTSGTGWEWGHPSLIPKPAQVGQYLWGTNLSGDYADTATNGIVLERYVDLSAIPSDVELTIQWWEYFDIPGGDYGIFSAGGEELHFVEGGSGGWIHRAYDLTPYIGQNIPLKWILTPNNDGVAGLGWYIDNISIHLALPKADLQIFKEASPDPVAIGESLAYTVTIYNHGPFTATDVYLYDYLPDGVTFEAANPALPQTSCNYEPGIHKVYCYVASMFPGEAIAVMIDTTVNADSILDGQVVNYARTFANEEDPVAWNNGVSLATEVSLLPSAAPRVDYVTPDSAIIPLVGKVITINGANFTLGMSAYLGPYELLNVTRLTHNRLEARIPNTVPAGTYPVSVVSHDGQVGRLLNAFTVMEDAPPRLLLVNPDQGMNDLPHIVDIYGENFSPGMAVYLNLPAETAIQVQNVYFINSTRLRAIIPFGLPASTYTIEVVDALSRSALLPGGYTVLDSSLGRDLLTYSTANFWSIPPTLQVGEVVTLGLTVAQRGGDSTLAEVAVDFYLGDPTTAGLEPIERGLTGPLAPYSAAPALVSWTPTQIGRTVLYAVIDPEDAVAEFNENNNVISRTVRVLPQLPDFIPPTIEVTINTGAQNTARAQVRLNTTVHVTGMDAPQAPTPSIFQPAVILYLEYQYAQGQADWQLVQSSGWLPYSTASANYLWQLSPLPGAHYIQAWVADAFGRIAPAPGLDEINLLLPEARLAENEAHLYRYQLPAGATILVRLTSLVGDADLYLWTLAGAEIDRREWEEALEEIEFTVPETGIYQIEVEGYTAAMYRLEIIPLNSGETLQAAAVWPGEPVNWLPSAPTPRGRGTVLSDDLPSQAIDLPELPNYPLFLPSIVR